MVGPFRGGRTSPPPAFPASRIISTSARWAEESGRARTPAGPGTRSSTASPSPRSGRSRSRRRTRRSSTSAPARPTCARTSPTATACTSPPTVERRGPPSVSRTRARSDGSSWTRRTPTASSSRRSATAMAPIPSAASSAPPTAARRGRRSSARTTTPGPSTSPSIRKTRRRSSPRSGRRGDRPGTLIRPRTAPAAASTARATAERTGARSRAVAFPPRSSAESASPSRRATRSASTRSWTRRREASTPPKTAARRGRELPRSRGSGVAAGTSAASPWIRKTLTRSMSATPGCTARPTPARRSSRSKAAPGGDDYHQLWIDPADPRRMIVASDQGAVVSVDGAKTWSQLVQPADRAVLPRRDRQPVSLLDLRRAAGHRRRRDPFAHRLWDDPPARLEADRGRRRERIHRARPHRSEHPLWRRRRPLRLDDSAGTEHRSHSRLPRRLQGRVDAPPGDLAAGSEAHLLRKPVPLQDDRRRAALGEGEPRPDARGPGRPRDSRPRHRERHARSPARAAASSTRSRLRP